MPSTRMGSPVFDNDVAGIMVSSPITDQLSVNVFWLRPFDAYMNDSDAGSNGSLYRRNFTDETDLLGIMLPMNFPEANLRITPWFMYGSIGASSGIYNYMYGRGTENTVGVRYSDTYDWDSHTHAWWLGTHLEIDLLDSLALSIEGVYGRMSRTGLSGLGAQSVSFDFVDNQRYRTSGYAKDIGTSGWYIASTLDYTLTGEGWSMTPGLFGWWASGDDKESAESGKLGRLPSLAQDNTFSPTSFGANGYYGVGQYDRAAILGTGTGTWGVGIQLADITFVERLKHTLRFAYYRGTNDSELVKKGYNRDGTPSDGYLGRYALNQTGRFYQYSADGLYLTDKDSVFEVNFDHQYQVYENLTAVLELGWLHLKSDEDTWRRYKGHGRDENDNAWKAQVSLRYSF